MLAGPLLLPAMDDANQIEVPPSFLAVYTDPRTRRLTEPAAAVRARYELCEDLAQLLVERAAAALGDRGAGEREVLAGMLQALRAEGSPVLPVEATWVTRRLAELLQWEDPGPDADDAPA